MISSRIRSTMDPLLHLKYLHPLMVITMVHTMVGHPTTKVLSGVILLGTVATKAIIIREDITTHVLPWNPCPVGMEVDHQGSFLLFEVFPNFCIAR